jgi:hypothetical protein
VAEIVVTIVAPEVAMVYFAASALVGYDPLTGHSLSSVERVLYALPVIGKAASVVAKAWEASLIESELVTAVRGTTTAERAAGLEAGLSSKAAAAEDGVSLSLKYNPGWNAGQRAAADAKVGALNDAAGSGGLRVTQVERSGTSAASRYSRAGGDIPSGADIDHTIDLQLGGLDELGNMSPLNFSVNRSLGSQIGWQLRDVPLGSCVIAVTIC